MQFINKVNLFYLLTTFVLLSAGCHKGAQQQTPAQQVKEFAVETIQPEQTVLKSAYPATIKGKQDIEIRPNVSGFITQLLVDEGSTVKKGQVLFKIDPVEYQAAVNVAQANVEVAQSNLETSRLTLQTRRNLRQQNIISEYEMQTAENDYASQQALLSQANAQLTNARKDLSYTNVTSPSDGIIGSIPYRVGSLVSSSIAEPLTIVSDITDMFVYFSMTEKQLLELTQAGGSDRQILDNMPLVTLIMANGSPYPEKGKIETLSGAIDPSTGSANIRATFPNSKHILRSGGTGVVEIPHVINNALVIPQKATYEIQDKKFVYLVTDSSTVKSTEIGIYELDNGKEYVVTQGLKSGDRIVVEGVISLKDGMKIKPITPQEAAARVQQAAGHQPEGASPGNAPAVANPGNNPQNKQDE